ncbi:MAG TPA: DUF5320 domain-containing protein [Candidatus Absconditabacterales bacterium]|nr:DUF5320 domain-containing protein [Candidatus Absconditabacterales bacterium]
MPNKDGTGPNGQGSATGRGMGNCGKKTENSNSNLGKRNGQGVRIGRLIGRGNGRGRMRD